MVNRVYGVGGNVQRVRYYCETAWIGLIIETVGPEESLVFLFLVLNYL